jgi:hypothetical protein
VCQRVGAAPPAPHVCRNGGQARLRKGAGAGQDDEGGNCTGEGCFAGSGRQHAW